MRKATLIVLATVFLLLPAARAQAEECAAPEPEYTPEVDEKDVATCTEQTFAEYPPSSGTHYPDWAEFMTYSEPVPPGFWLHSVRHGAIAFLYNCPLPEGCAEDVAALQAIADGYPADTLCEAPIRNRILIAPDTRLATRFAAVAWTWSLESDCLDTTAFRAFLDARYAKGMEEFCGGGRDLSATGWCEAPVSLARPGTNLRTSPASPAGRLFDARGRLLDRRYPASRRSLQVPRGPAPMHQGQAAFLAP